MTNWRHRHDVLVPHAQAMGSIGVIRSLGRAGYRVTAASDDRAAIGLRSAFASRAVVYPPYDTQPAAFVQWLETMVAQGGVSAIVPSDGLLVAVRERFASLAEQLPLSRDLSVVFKSLSKFDLFDAFRGSPLERCLPPFLLAADRSVLPSAAELEVLGTPLFIKVDAVHARNGGPSIVIRCESASKARLRMSELQSQYRRIMVQGFVRGVGVGVFLIRWRGRILARFMHRRLHEVPHTGGASSFRESWWHETIFRDAVERADVLGWEGVAMFEYRWDPDSDAFRLMELNGRFWGSIHLALYAGVDFPRLLLDAFFGHEEVCEQFALPMRCRWTFPREVEYVWSRLKDLRLPLRQRAGSVFEFLLLGLDPRVRSDLNFPGDRTLYWLAMSQSWKRWIRREEGIR